MTRKRWLTASSLLLPALVLAGCGAEDGSSVTTRADPRQSIEGTWYPLAIAGYTVDSLGVATYPKAYLDFKDGRWRGNDGCNGQSGTYQLSEDGAFDMTAGASTQMGCANVPHTNVMDRATRVEVDGDLLIFSAQDEIARYSRTKNPPPTRSDDPGVRAPAASTVRKFTEPSIPPQR